MRCEMIGVGVGDEGEFPRPMRVQPQPEIRDARVGAVEGERDVWGDGHRGEGYGEQWSIGPVSHPLDKICRGSDSRSPLDKAGSGKDRVSMKQITVSVEDDLYQRAEARATELDKSLPVIVRELIVGFTTRKGDFGDLKRLEEDTVAKIRERGIRFSASDRLSRAELHDRNPLR